MGRPSSPQFETVEIRVMDTPINMKHLLGLVALCQSLIAGISERIDCGATSTTAIR